MAMVDSFVDVSEDALRQSVISLPSQSGVETDISALHRQVEYIKYLLALAPVGSDEGIIHSVFRRASRVQVTPSQIIKELDRLDQDLQRSLSTSLSFVAVTEEQDVIKSEPDDEENGSVEKSADVEREGIAKEMELLKSELQRITQEREELLESAEKRTDRAMEERNEAREHADQLDREMQQLSSFGDRKSVEINDLNSRIERQKEEFVTLQGKYDVLAVSLEKVNAEYVERCTEVQGQKQLLLEESGKAKVLVDQLEELKREKVVVEFTVKTQEEKLQKAIDLAQERQAESNTSLHSVKILQIELEKSRKDAETARSNALQQVEDIRAKEQQLALQVTQLSTEKQAFAQQLLDTQNDLNEVRGKAQSDAQSAHDTMAEMAEKLAQATKDLHTAQGETAKAKEEADKSVANLQSELEKQKQIYTNLENELKKTKSVLTQKESEFGDLRSKVDSADIARKQSEQKVAALDEQNKSQSVEIEKMTATFRNDIAKREKEYVELETRAAADVKNATDAGNASLSKLTERYEAEKKTMKEDFISTKDKLLKESSVREEQLRKELSTSQKSSKAKEEEHSSQLEKQKTGHEEAMKSVKVSHEEVVRNIQAAHEKALKMHDEEQRKLVEIENKKDQDQLNKQTKEWTLRMAKAQKLHADEIAGVKSKAEQTQRKLIENQVKALSAKMDEVAEAHAEEQAKAKEHEQATIQQIKSQHEVEMKNTQTEMSKKLEEQKSMYEKEMADFRVKLDNTSKEDIKPLLEDNHKDVVKTSHKKHGKHSNSKKNKEEETKIDTRRTRLNTDNAIVQKRLSDTLDDHSKLAVESEQLLQDLAALRDQRKQISNQDVMNEKLVETEIIRQLLPQSLNMMTIPPTTPQPNQPVISNIVTQTDDQQSKIYRPIMTKTNSPLKIRINHGKLVKVRKKNNKSPLSSNGGNEDEEIVSSIDNVADMFTQLTIKPNFASAL